MHTQIDVDQRRRGWSKRRSFSSSELIGQRKTKAAAAAAAAAAVPGGSHRVRSDRRLPSNGVGGMSTVSHAVAPVAHRNDVGTTSSASKCDDRAIRETFLDGMARRDVGGIATRDVKTVVDGKHESIPSIHNVNMAMLLVMDNGNTSDERERRGLTNISTLMTSLSMAVTECRLRRSPSDMVKFEIDELHTKRTKSLPGLVLI
jgi:hypothetical protein